MLRLDDIKSATDALLGAATAGEDWSEALKALAVASGARDVAIIRNRNRKLIAAIGSPEIVPVLDDYLKGRSPPNSRQTRVSHDVVPGFRIDQDDYSREQLDRDPFYQDFLRPLGLFWHANARLDYEPGEELAISFKRALRTGPYEAGDAQVLNVILSDVKAAARIAHRVLDAEASGVARLLHNRGDAVFELDTWGRVRRVHGFGDDTRQPLRILGGRLVAAHGISRARLDAAVAAATQPPQRTALVALRNAAGEPYYLQIVPVRGLARDVFHATAAVSVLVARTPRLSRVSIDRFITHDLFGLTEREVEVAALLAEGLSLVEIAGVLRIQPGTVRNHLKSVFEKTGTSRQGELVALLARVMP